MIPDMLKGIAIGIGAAVIGVFAVLVGIFAIFLFAILGALIGAITGFILQFVPILGPMVKTGFTMIGVVNPDLTALGAMLGFVGGFFKSGPGAPGKKCECS